MYTYVCCLLVALLLPLSDPFLFIEVITSTDLGKWGSGGNGMKIMK
jgi:hypothetical protein